MNLTTNQQLVIDGLKEGKTIYQIANENGKQSSVMASTLNSLVAKKYKDKFIEDLLNQINLINLI